MILKILLGGPAVMFLTMIVIAAANGEHSLEPAPRVVKPEVPKCAQLREAKHVAQHFVGQKTRGAEFPRDPEVVWELDGTACVYHVAGTLTGLNAFGARVSARYDVRVRPEGRDWRLL